MKSSTIINHTNPNPLYNCTHVNAWAVASWVETWTRYNLLYLFKPPRVESIVLIPLDTSQVNDERFEIDMFTANGIFVDMQLNHYLEVNTGAKQFMINAGFLLNRFILGDDIGYSTLKYLIDTAKEPGQ